MNTIPLHTKRTISIIGLIFICACASASAATFAVKITTDKFSYVPDEPVTIQVSIQHTGQVAIDVNNPLDQGDYREDVHVGLKGSSLHRFTTIDEASDELQDRTAYPKIHLDPGSTITRRQVLCCWHRRHIPVGHSQEIFSKPGEYIIRFTARWKEELDSDEITIAVKDFNNPRDREAHQWLVDNGMLCQLPYLAHHERKESLTSSFKPLMEKYSNSVYAVFVQKILARTTQSPTNVVLSPMGVVLKDLLAERYDPRGFPSDSPNGANVYLEKLMSLNDELGQGKISQEEFERRHAEWYKECVRKYCHPLTPEEFKKRSETYAKEDEARAKEREIQTQKYIEWVAPYLREKRKEEKPK